MSFINIWNPIWWPTRSSWESFQCCITLRNVVRWSCCQLSIVYVPSEKNKVEVKGESKLEKFCKYSVPTFRKFIILIQPNIVCNVSTMMSLIHVKFLYSSMSGWLSNIELKCRGTISWVSWNFKLHHNIGFEANVHFRLPYFSCENWWSVNNWII